MSKFLNQHTLERKCIRWCANVRINTLHMGQMCILNPKDYLERFQLLHVSGTFSLRAIVVFKILEFALRVQFANECVCVRQQIGV